MAHEHTGNCCTPHEHEATHHHHAQHVGHQCLQGMCAHPEHQFLHTQEVLQMQRDIAERQVPEAYDAGLPEAKKKRKKSAKKKAGLTLSQLLFVTG